MAVGLRNATLTDSSPTRRRRELGMRLRDLRDALGMTVEEVAEKLLCSASKISRAETGARKPSLREVRGLCALYNVGAEESAQLTALAREARQQGWWRQYDDLKIPQLIGLEQEAAAITYFSRCFVPALLETAGYATAMINNVLPGIDSNILRRRVEARVLRRQLLEQPKLSWYRALLDEAALHWPVDGPGVMRSQLKKILRCAEEGKLTFQAIPFNVGEHASTDGDTVFVEFGDSSLQRPLVLVERLFSSLHQECSAEIELYLETFETVRNVALRPRATLDLNRDPERERPP
jgi:transcriptional regulator with XRE-family HTH domain